MIDTQIYTSHSDKYNNKNRYKGTYLHGKIEEEYEFDIFSFERKQKFFEGIHHFQVNKKDASFFLWKVNNEPEWRGFLVYTTDEKAYKHALDCYVTKKSII